MITCQPKTCCTSRKTVDSLSLRRGCPCRAGPRRWTRSASRSWSGQTCQRKCWASRRCRSGGRCTCRKSVKKENNMVERGLFSGKSMNQVNSWNGHYLLLTYQHCTCRKSVKRKQYGWEGFVFWKIKEPSYIVEWPFVVNLLNEMHGSFSRNT